MSAIKLMVLQVNGFWVEIAMTKVVEVDFGCVIFHIIHDKQRNCWAELTHFLTIFELER